MDDQFSEERFVLASGLSEPPAVEVFVHSHSPIFRHDPHYTLKRQEWEIQRFVELGGVLEARNGADPVGDVVRAYWEGEIWTDFDVWRPHEFYDIEWMERMRVLEKANEGLRHRVRERTRTITLLQREVERQERLIERLMMELQEERNR